MMFSSSEELQVMFNDNTLDTTVINGGTGGSVSNTRIYEDIIYVFMLGALLLCVGMQIT